MNYAPMLAKIRHHVDSHLIVHAVRECLRLSRALNDYFYAAYFHQELFYSKREVTRILQEDAPHLSQEALEFYCRRAGEYWFEAHSFDPPLAYASDGSPLSVLDFGVGEIDQQIKDCASRIASLSRGGPVLPTDWLSPTDSPSDALTQQGIRKRALEILKQRIITRCLNYAIQIEKRIHAQDSSEQFLSTMQNTVDNYFKAHSPDVHSKLEKAMELVRSRNHEEFALLLTEVRRAIKAAADHLYPPASGPVRCADGIERILDDAKYLNRLQEYIESTFQASTATDLLKAKCEVLSVFGRRLNDLGGKGVHADVTANEAKQGLLGLYFLLFSIVSRLEDDSR